MQMIPYHGPNFTMQVPSDWFATSNPQVQVVIYPTEHETNVPPSYGVMIQAVDDDELTAEEAAQDIISENQANYDAYQIIDQEPIDYGGQDGYWVHFAWRNDRGEPIEQEQFVAHVGRYIYMSILTIPDGTAPEHVNMLHTMQETFHFDG